MEDLFAVPEPEPEFQAQVPLAARLRPRTLEEIQGQKHLLGPGKALRRLIEADRLTSVILFGPPGVGKTTLAEVIAHRTRSRFERLNAVEANLSDVRKVLALAAQRRAGHAGASTLVFIDEIHRFNKSQQDVLLPDVENGTIHLIGATTHNPSFYVNGPLVSRSQVFELQPLPEESLEELIDLALHDRERGLGHYQVEIEPEARQHLIHISEGDARRLLNSLEIAVLSTVPQAGNVIHLNLQNMEDCVQRKMPVYDRGEDQHYDTISAYIKSVRGSDPDSALYWLAKMLVAGEDPRFIARRLVILASEDVGLADPRGLMVAMAAQQALEFLGMPEGRIPLAEVTVYLATAPKSNASYRALDEAMAMVKQESTVSVPQHLKDAHYPGAKKLGHGLGYEYSHDYPEAISGQSFGIEPGRFYHPTGRGFEREIKERLERWRELRKT